MRAAVLGCGAIGTGSDLDPHPDVGVITHAGAYASCADTTLVAVCDADPARAADAAARWGARAFTDAAALLDEVSPELVSVATPDATHADLVERCLRADSVRGVLAEKPLALDAAAARALVARGGATIAVNYSRRYAPAFQALRKDLGIGELQHVGGLYVKGLAHNGSHWLDLLRMLAGEPLAVRGHDRLGEGGPDPTLDAELRLASGARVVLAGLDTARYTAFEMDLVGTDGRLRVTESGHVLERWAVGDDPRHPGYRVLRPAGRIEGALRDTTLHAVEDLVDCVRTGATPACDGDDGVAALTLVDAVRASAAEGGLLWAAL